MFCISNCQTGLTTEHTAIVPLRRVMISRWWPSRVSHWLFSKTVPHRNSVTYLLINWHCSCCLEVRFLQCNTVTVRCDHI